MAKNNEQPVQNEQVATTVSSVETFIKKNEKVIEWVLIGLIVIACGILAYNKWYLTPVKAEAQGQMFPAEQMFMAGEFESALNGDGNILGFAQIADQYGSKAGKSVWLYSGICNLKLGNNEEAVKNLKKYKSSDKVMMGRALCCLGDAYANLGDNSTALSYFKKAASVSDNMFAAGYLLKAGIISEEMGDKAAALKFYQQIKDEYPQSMEGYDIDKYITRINEAE